MTSLIVAQSLWKHGKTMVHVIGFVSIRNHRYGFRTGRGHTRECACGTWPVKLIDDMVGYVAVDVERPIGCPPTIAPTCWNKALRRVQRKRMTKED